MARWFSKESEIEYWMRPYTGLVMMPGYERVLHNNTRLFFDFYWQLLLMGYSETQLADYVVRRRWGTKPPAPHDLAFVKAVYHLARHKQLRPSRAFNYFPDGNHPRDIQKRLK